MRLNITSDATSSVPIIALEMATSVQSGARPNTRIERKPSTMAVSGLSRKNSRYCSGTTDSG